MGRQPTNQATSLLDLLHATGTLLRENSSDRASGACPLCGEDLSVDLAAQRFSCQNCGEGDATTLAAALGGFSMTKAAELLSAGWLPERSSPPGRSSRGRVGSIRALPLPCGPDADDQTVLDAVLRHYQGARQRSEAANRWLKARGVDGALADELSIGFSDRTLGHRLPNATRKDGAGLRGRLLRLGVYRDTGHEHFRGCIVVPVLDTDGRIVQLYGRRVEPDRGPTEVWAAGLPGGLFIAGHGDEVMVRDSLPDALRALAVNPSARVVAPGRPEGFLPEDQTAFAALGLVASGLADPPSLRDDHGDDRHAAADPDHPAPEPSTASEPSPQAVMPALDGQAVSVARDASIPEAGEAAVSVAAGEARVVIGSRHWRVRGASRAKGYEMLRVNLSVTDERSGAFHLDTLDLYAARARAGFVVAAADELRGDRRTLTFELARVLAAAEHAADAIPADDQPDETVVMTPEERDEAMAWLCSPDLADRVTADVAALGVVGEERNALLLYLACVSRLAERPLGVVVQSSSAAGKSTLADAVLSLMPGEARVSFSAMTGQALYYLGADDLSHKVLSVAEEEGAERATYALKLLQSEGRLSIAAAGKDPDTGRLRTNSYTVAGPVALVTTTTAAVIDEELANRLITLSVAESPEQTRAIHEAQRRSLTLAGLTERHHRQVVIARHHNAQRLLEPLAVVVPMATELAFSDTTLRARRDHAKYLGIICSSALLHQHQRQRRTVTLDGVIVSYVEATTDDVALADRLAAEVLSRSGAELPPASANVLHALAAWAPTRSFTRREAREALGAGDTQLKVHLRRLVELEYVIATKQRGTVRYQLAWTPPPATPSPMTADRAGSDPKWAGAGRPSGGTRAGRGRAAKNSTSPQLNGGFPGRSSAESRRREDNASVTPPNTVPSYPTKPSYPGKGDGA